MPNGHEASLVCIEVFIPYFKTDLFMINHHMVDLFLYDRDNRGIELLAIQASCSPIPADRAKLMVQMCANSWHLALLNQSTSRVSSKASSQASRSSSRASSRAKSRASNTSRSSRHCQDSNGPFLVGPHNLTLESTLHNISIDLTTMDSPVDGTLNPVSLTPTIWENWYMFIISLL